MSQNSESTAKPLLQRSPLFPGESLPSLLARLSIANFYPSLSVLEKTLQLCWPDRSDCPISGASFMRLEQLTEIPALDLLLASDYGATPRPPLVKPLKKQPRSPFEEAMRYIPGPREQDFHPTKASWYCPKCLAEAAYHRQAWRPMCMAICLQHDCLLVSVCPVCQHPVSISDLVLLRCQKCQADLRQANSIPLDGDERGRFSQAALLKWRTNAPISDLEYGWPVEQAALLCSLAEGLAAGVLSLVDYLPPHRFKPDKPMKVYRLNDYRLHIQPSQVYWAYAYAIEFMANWPEGFRTFLHAAAPTPESVLGPNMGPFYPYWITKQWKHPDFQFIRRAWEDFQYDRSWFVTAATRLPTTFAQAPYFARLGDAARILNIPESALIQLGQLNLVAKLCSTDNAWPERYFLLSDIRKLKQAWSQPLSLEGASEWLGLAPDTVFRLAKEHVLKGSFSSTGELSFAKRDVANLLSGVNDHSICVEHENADLVRLTDAAEQLRCIHLDEARLLKLVVSRQVCARRSLEQQKYWDCGQISFTRKNLDRLMSESAEARGWISAEDAAFDLAVEDEVFLDWIERGLLASVATYNGQPYLKQRALEKFQTEYIFFNEARVLLGITIRRMMGYVRRGTLVPVAGPNVDGCCQYMFLRRKVDRLAKRLQKRSSPA